METTEVLETALKGVLILCRNQGWSRARIKEIADKVCTETPAKR